MPRKTSYKMLGATLLALAAGVTGCAPLPSLEKPAAPKPLSGYQTAQSFQAPAGRWPAERWWQSYGDPQLDALIDEALRDSPDMASAAARLRQAEAFGRVARSTLLPQVTGNAGLSYQRLSENYLTPSFMTPRGWNDYEVATLDLNWELDFWGKNRAALAAATSLIDAGRAEIAQARLSLAAAVATDYATLAELFSIRDTVARSVAIRKRTAELFEERFANGLETRGSLSQAKARLAEMEGELLVIDEQIGLEGNRLAALLGAGPDRALAIRRPAVRLAGDWGFPRELAANLLGRRTDVAVSRLLVEAQAHRIDQKKGEFYPNVNLSAFIGLQSLTIDKLARSGSLIGSVGPAVSLPIFSAGRLQGELRGAAAAYDEAVAGYNRTVTQALQEVANLGLSRKALGAELSKAAAAVASAADAHRVVSDRYRGGLATYLEVLYAEDLLLSTQRNLANLQSRAFTLDVALNRALGGGYREKKI
jgi:NodT family efflux transporter outer membrane factor (OMF) lipoprotein